MLGSFLLTVRMYKKIRQPCPLVPWDRLQALATGALDRISLLHLCIVNLFINVCMYSSNFFFLFSFALTLLFVLPSSLKLLSKPTLWQFKLALVSGVMILCLSLTVQRLVFLTTDSPDLLVL